MLIGKNWKIDSDGSLNIILCKRHVPQSGKNKGKEEWNAVGYYSTAQSALRDMVEQEIKGAGLKDFELVCQKIAELGEVIDGLQGLPSLPNPMTIATMPL